MRHTLAVLVLLATPAFAQADEAAQLAGEANCEAFIPSSALKDVHRGEATIAFRVVADGSIADAAVKTTSGYGELDETARACVASRSYRPAMRQGQTVDSDPTAKIFIATPKLHVCVLRGVMWDKVRPLQGVSRVKFTIDTTGHTGEASIAQTSGQADLDDASLACIKLWRYLPAVKDGKAVVVPWDADIAWNVPSRPERFTDMTKCVRDVALTRDDLAAVRNPTTVSYNVIGGMVFDLKLDKSSGNKRLDNAALQCASHTKFRETVVIGASPGFQAIENIDWKAVTRPKP